MTIERAELQLDDAFDFGQVYVALSRITSLEGLWVKGGRIEQSVVKAHPKVKAFYQKNGSALRNNDRSESAPGNLLSASAASATCDDDSEFYERMFG